MRIECENCNAAFTISDALLSDQPIGAQCPYCGHVRIVKKGDSPRGAGGDPGGDAMELGLGPSFGESAPSFPSLGGPSRPLGSLVADLGGAPSSGPRVSLERFGPGGGGYGAPSGTSLPPSSPLSPHHVSDPPRTSGAPPSVCKECGVVLNDEFDKVIGLCDRHQRERGGGRPSASSGGGGDGGGVEIDDRGWHEREGKAPPRKPEPRGGPSAPRPVVTRRSRSRISLGKVAAALFLGASLLGGGYLALNPTIAESLLARISHGDDGAPVLPPNPIRRERASWKVDNVTGTAADQMNTAKARHLEDTETGYRQAHEAYQRALVLDEDNAGAIAGYYENLAIWRGPLLSEAELDVGDGAVRYAIAASPKDAAPHRAKAALAWVRGDLNACRAAAEKALEIDAHDPRARLLLAGSYLEGNAPLAVRDLELVAGKAPELRRTDRVLARALANAGRYASATKLIDQRMAADPGNGAVRKVRGDLSRDLGEFEQAKQHYRAAIAAPGDQAGARLALGELLIELGENATATEIYRPVVEDQRLPPRYRAQALAALSRAEIALGRNKRATDYARAALLLDPREPVAFLSLSEVALIAGTASVAEAMAKKVLEVRSGEPAALVALARAALLQRKTEQAIKYAEEAAQNDPRDPRLHAILGAMYLAAGGGSQAFTVMKRAADLDPSERDSRQRKGLTAIPPRALKEAILRYREASKEMRDRSVAHSSIAIILYQSGDTPGAREALETALEVDEANGAALLYSAQLALERGAGKQAQELAQKLLRADRALPVGLLTLGRALAVQSEHKDAAEAFSTALRANPGLVAADVERAEVLLKQGRRDEAISILSEAYRVNPHLLRTRRLLLEAGA